MIKYYSIKIKLNDVIYDKNYEYRVLENIRRCKRICGRNFKVIFWYKDLKESIIEDFVERNKHLLFEINTKITEKNLDCWFEIDSSYENNGGNWRYRYNGDILNGLVKCMELINHMTSRDE